jgi:chemotaxis response regulator CheB
MAKDKNYGTTIAKALMRQLISQTLSQQKKVKLAGKAAQEDDADAMLEYIKEAQAVNKEAANTMSAITDQMRGAIAE